MCDFTGICTLPDRLVKELHLRDIWTAEEVNHYLPVFILSKKQILQFFPIPFWSCPSTGFEFGPGPHFLTLFDTKVYQFLVDHSLNFYINQEILIARYHVDQLSAWFDRSKYYFQLISVDCDSIKCQTLIPIGLTWFKNEYANFLDGFIFCIVLVKPPRKKRICFDKEFYWASIQKQ